MRRQDGSQDGESQLILIRPQILNLFEEKRKAESQWREMLVFYPCCELGITCGYLNWVLLDSYLRNSSCADTSLTWQPSECERDIPRPAAQGKRMPWLGQCEDSTFTCW